jgi:hypothetical protein
MLTEVKYAHVALTLSLTGSIFAACSAAGNHGGTSSTGLTGGGTTGVGASGGGGATVVTTGTGGATGASTSGTGGATSSSSSGATGGSTSSSSSSSSSSSGLIGFDGGWQIPDSGTEPPLLGDGGTTTEIVTGADGTSPGKFGGSSTGGAVSVVYPPSGVVLPPNMNSLEIHFIPAPGQTLFEIAFHAPTQNLKVYTGCTPLNGGCVYTPDQAFWASFVGYARGTQPVTWTIRGVNGASPGAVGTSAQQKMTFVDQDLIGGLYYWNTAGLVQRYDFGFPNAPAQNYMNALNAGAFVCVGCHAMARDGARIAVGKDIPYPAPFEVFDVLTKAPIKANGQPVTGQANFMSFAPNDKLMLISDGISIGTFNIPSAAVLPNTTIYPGTMPDWSPDGTHMVYAQPKSPPFFTVPGVDSASIVSMHWNGAGWDGPQTLVPFAGQNNYYPAYSPDGSFVVYNRSPGNRESFANASPDPDAGTVPDGELWAVPSGGGAQVRLSAASDPGALSWPKWAPVKDDYYGGKIMWLTFSSARPYGLRLAKGAKTQLWMVAFDPAKAAAGRDATFPAFWLPFQDINGGNHIAQWVTSIPRHTCQTSADCDQGEHCLSGNCVPG